METKQQIINKCKSVLARDKNYVDNLPLDEDIIDILAKTKFLKRVDEEVPYDKQTDLEYMEEPNIFSYEATFNEYGYKLAGRKMLPDFIDSCLEMAVNLQSLRNMENEKYHKNKELDEERIGLMDKIDELRLTRNALYKEMGKTYNLDTETVEKAISNSDLALNLAGIPIGGVSGLSSLATGTLGAAGLGSAAGSLGLATIAGSSATAIGAGAAASALWLPIGALIGVIGLVAYGSNRKKKYIMKGMAEAEEYFTKALIKLRKSTKMPTIQALNAIKELKEGIVGIIADIDEANYIISRLKVEIAFIQDSIALKKG